MRTLVLAAHPDDEVLGCGGTIARLAREGHDVFVAVLGEGITSRCDQAHESAPSLLMKLKECASEASQVLGVKDLFMYDLPDNRFDTVPLLDVAKIIEEILGMVSPDTVFTQHGGDLNVDHQVVYKATLTATRPVGKDAPTALYAYEVASSTEWAFQKFTPQFSPNTFWDITTTLNVKVRAAKCYESELRPFPHPRSVQVIEAMAHRWGSVAGREAAEAFELVRRVL